MSTSVRFVLTYVAVLTTMLTWWLAMKQAATIGSLALVVVAYAVPVAAWWAVVARTRDGQTVHDER
ncbi:MAG: hypothetical protein BMS9Abin17_0189 [Acidimicrobiia bacterium]|nr:MAG: hypothetical protein BMS9Abin17_0189 [Acidimicrobiia bacterium]